MRKRVLRIIPITLILFGTIFVRVAQASGGGGEGGGNAQSPVQVIVQIIVTAIVLKVLDGFGLP